MDWYSEPALGGIALHALLLKTVVEEACVCSVMLFVCTKFVHTRCQICQSGCLMSAMCLTGHIVNQLLSGMRCAVKKTTWRCNSTSAL